MECDTCLRNHDATTLPFLCAVDARNRIYESRVKHTELLLANEALEREIEQCQARNSHDDIRASMVAAQETTTRVLEAAARLRSDVQAARAEIAERQATLAKRRAQLASASEGLAERRQRQLDDIQQKTQLLAYKWARDAEDMTAARVYICKELGWLYDLRRTKISSSRYNYHIGKVPVVDLSTLNTLSPDVISTSLANITHVLILASHYLSVRLPAEITLPHADYPRPTIFSLLSSYNHGPISFPSHVGSLQGDLRDPAAARAPRPRPLFVDRPLPQLYKEDSVAHSFFVEGLSLLMYDVAWLSSSQGISIGDRTSFDDVSNMGRNLYNLLNKRQAPHAEGPFPAGDQAKPATTEGHHVEQARAALGRFSHGTTYHALSAAEGTDVIKSFRLPAPMKIADRLKKKLIGDAPVVDWEVLEDDAWKEETTEDPKIAVDKVRLGTGTDSPRTNSGAWMKVRGR